MTTETHALPIDPTRWEIPSGAQTVFNWQYDAARDSLLNLYTKGKHKQWDAADRLDWSAEINPGNPLEYPEAYVPIYGSPMWEKLNEKERGEVRRQHAAWQFSQFLHGEQGALICTAKIVQTVPDLDSKFYAATQVMDEARHVEVYARYLHEKIQLVYPINSNLKLLLDQAIRDSRWDFTYLAMQILIEGLALGAFAVVRDLAQEPLAKSLTAYVMQDEARHVAFGRIALRDYYPQLSQSERDQREEFTIEACHLMRDRFNAEEVWESVGLDVDACVRYLDEFGPMRREFRSRLFSRIVPTLRDIGIWGDRVQRAFEDMGVMQFASLDPSVTSEQDERVAEEFEQLYATRTETGRQE